MNLSCKLSCVEIQLGVTSAFTESFKDDYAITVDNGDGATQVFDKENLGKKYYFQTPEQQNHLTVSVKATSIEGNLLN